MYTVIRSTSSPLYIVIGQTVKRAERQSIKSDNAAIKFHNYLLHIFSQIKERDNNV